MEHLETNSGLVLGEQPTSSQKPIVLVGSLELQARAVLAFLRSKDTPRLVDMFMLL